MGRLTKLWPVSALSTGGSARDEGALKLRVHASVVVVRTHCRVDVFDVVLECAELRLESPRLVGELRTFLAGPCQFDCLLRQGELEFLGRASLPCGVSFSGERQVELLLGLLETLGVRSSFPMCLSESRFALFELQRQSFLGACVFFARLGQLDLPLFQGELEFVGGFSELSGRAFPGKRLFELLFERPSLVCESRSFIECSGEFCRQCLDLGPLLLNS